jgi:16S rRNA (guanine527-N7)-methyltransferase
MASTVHQFEPHLRELLVPVTASWGLRVDESMIAALAHYGVELLRWNERANLTRITTPRDVVVRHFLDSLACATAFERPPASLVDIGTGAGFPGIPLKLLWRDLQLALNESIGKKAAFLQHVVDLLQLDRVEVVTARAEHLGRSHEHRERYDGVVARAVAALNVLSEYALPLCRVGGRLVAPKGGAVAAEVEQAHTAIERLGGQLTAVLPVELPEVEPRTLVVVEKVRLTPEELPRAVGVPAKRPL